MFGRVAAILAHLAAYSAAYVAASVVYLSQTSGHWPDLPRSHRLALVLIAFLTAMGTYLLDRVKLRDAWLDPADAIAQPRRYEFLARHTRSCRGLIVVCLLAAALAGAWLHTELAFVSLVSAAGVVLYAGRPKGQGQRPKDVLIVKNLYVAGGIVGFACVLLLGAMHPPTLQAAARSLAAPAFIFGAVTLGVRVAADAVLCDLDDTHADAAYGTHTLPTRFGRDAAWRIAFFTRLGTALALAIIPLGPMWPRLAWATCTVVSSAALRAAAPGTIRDWVDSRFAFEAVAASVALAIFAG